MSEVVLPGNDELTAEDFVETSMDIGVLHGYLMALAISPAMVMPSL